jgi:hypothetical protein
MSRNIAVIGGILSFGVIPSFATVYNATNDFPGGITTSTSPTNGPWSYGYASTLNPVDFTLYNNATSDYFGDGNTAGFFTQTSGGGYGFYNLPTVLKNTTGSTLGCCVEAGTIGPWPANLLLMHPGPTGLASVVRFTAPSSALYVVSGEFVAMGNYSGQTTDSVSFTSGLTSTQLASTASSSNPYFFSFSQFMNAGQSLDFSVGLGPNGQFYWDSTGFDATITSNSEFGAPTPEPAFYGTLALGLTGLFVAARRRKNV